MLERGLNQRKTVSTSARRTRQVHNQRAAAHARNATAEQAVRRLLDRICAQRLGDPGDETVENRFGGLGSEVARRDTRTTRRQDQMSALRQLTQRRRDLRTLVGYDSVFDVELLLLQEPHEERAAFVLPLA